MGVYIFNIIQIIIMKPIIDFFCREKRKKYIICVGICLLLLLVLKKENIGSDTGPYILRFYCFGNTSWRNLSQVATNVESELGYAVFNKILYYLFPYRRTIIYVTAFIFIFGYCIWIYEKSKNPCLSFILFVCLGIYGGCFLLFRQMIATVITMLSYQYMEKGNLKKFLLVILIASFFHTSALCMLPIYFLKDKKIDLSIIIIWLCGNLFCLLYGTKIVRYFVYKERYAEFISKGSNGDWGMLLLNLCFIILMFLVYKNNNERKERIYLYSEMIFFSLCILTFSLSIVSRSFSYYKTALMISLPNTLYRIHNTYTRGILTILLVTVLLGYYFFIICRADSSSLVPYEFMWN